MEITKEIKSALFVRQPAPTLETMEPVFQQDLNRDGVIGLYAAPGTTQHITNALAGTTGSATIGTGATLEPSPRLICLGDLRRRHRNAAT